MTIPTTLTGVAGEYFVAAELSRRGYIASISLRNTRGIDILVTNQNASRSITIQCKTKQGGEKSWGLDKKCEDFFAPDHYYVFVALTEENERPSFHIIPSDTLAKLIADSHQRYLQKPRNDGRPRADTRMRRFSDFEDKYLDRWELLGL